MPTILVVINGKIVMTQEVRQETFEEKIYPVLEDESTAIIETRRG